MALPASPAAAAPPDAPLVHVRGLARSFGARRAVAGLSLDVHGGEIVGLVGANGGGKTTALRMLAGLLAPDAGHGEVLFCRLPGEAARIRCHVGYAAQRLALYGELSVLENLRFRADVYGVARPRERAAAVLEELGLTPFATARAEQLSGGWARRLQLAAALLHEPRLLLLDEPTAGLDAPSRQEVWQRLAALARAGRGVVICTHDLAEAERCARVLFLAGGRVVAQGAPEAVASSVRAAALLLHGVAAGRLERALGSLDGVLSLQGRGAALRAVVARHALPRAQDAARALGARIEPDAVRLEDAALVLARAATRAPAGADPA